MVRLIRNLLIRLRGGYIVTQDLRYGQYRKQRMLKRFKTLNEAKDFARDNVAELRSHIAVISAHTLQTVCVYKPRMREATAAFYP